MKHRIAIVLAAFAGLAGLAAGCSQSPQEDPAQAARRAQWASVADLPDWSGIWEIDWRNERGSPPRPQMNLLPAYQQRLDAWRKAQERGENLQGEAANCVPPGLPGIMTQPYPIEFVYQPDKVVMLIEAYMQFRNIHTDGRALPEDPDPAFMGHSVGHWEDDTLVVESAGFNGSTELARGVPHSDKLKITERFRRLDADWMEVQTTLDDPEIFTEPYTSSTFYRHLDDEIREYICLENNRDGADEKGRPSMSLE